MTMNVIAGTSNLSSDFNRRVTIEVLGGSNQEPVRNGIYTITVPYSCFSETLQGISRRGGTVLNVTTTASQADLASSGGQRNSRSGRRSRTRAQRNTRSTRIQRTKRQQNQQTTDKPLSETFLKRLFASNN